MKSTLVANFSLVNQPESCVNAYNKECLGCQKVGADIMLTFGSKISVLGGNNQEVAQEDLRFVDVFLTKTQAEKLLKQLNTALMDNCFKS